MNHFIFYFVINIFIYVGSSEIIKQYFGCYRTFTGSKININQISVDSCLEECKSRNTQTFVALKNGSECQCGNDFRTSTQESHCSIKCVGSNADKCGGQDGYSIYSVCSVGYYGQNCDKTCSACEHSVPCARYNGNCYLSKCRRHSREQCDIARYIFKENNDCTDCINNEKCEQLKFSNKNYKSCSCKDGYHKENIYSQCEDINECQNNRHSCNTTTSKCLNNNGSYSCECNGGFEHRGYNKVFCYDVDECTNMKHKCDDKSTHCLNTDGSYVCNCRTGYNHTNTINNGLLIACNDFDECRYKTHSCNTTTSKCLNNNGSYSCECNGGFEHRGYNKVFCYDVDECTNMKHKCDDKSTYCLNTDGSYVCNCRTGYHHANTINNGLIIACNDIDECNDNKNACDKQSTKCQNIYGSYRCNCKEGFSPGNVNSCTDIDECSSYKNDCDEQTAACKNVDGGYQCICNDGYQYKTGSNSSCEDLNECEKITFNPDSTDCINEIGSYELKCKDGYLMEGNKRTCKDIDECQQTGNYDSSVICTNTIGSVTFNCSEGFYLVEEFDKYACKANWSAGKTAAGIFIVLVLILLGIFALVMWKKKHERNYSEKIPSSNSCKLSSNIPKIPQIQTEVSFSNIDEKQKRSTTRIKMKDLSNHIKIISEKDCFAFEDEFKAIPKVMEKLSTSYAEQPVMKPKNRFVNITPYNHSRVVLRTTGEKHSDYINASNITGFENTVAMVAAQGPTDETVNDFWRMIMEQNVNNIVMLTQLVENGKNKCTLYWPEERGNCSQFGNILVKNISVVIWEKFVRRDLTVTNMVTNKVSGVMQWQYFGWPDHGVPTEVQSFLRFRNNVRACMDQSGKTLVHCSAGVGRTGCFIAIDVLLEEAESKGSVDVVSCVTDLRQQRAHMVQTAVQYDFIYLALKLAFEEPNFYIPIKTFHKRFLEIYKTDKERKSEIAEEFELVTKQISENNNNISLNGNEWKASFIDGIDSTNKYIFASFPCQCDVDMFWELCFRHCKVIIVLNHVKDYKLPFMPNKIKSLVIKESKLELTNSLPLGVLSLDTVSVSNSKEGDNIYENKAMMTTANNQSKEFRVIRVHVNNKDILLREIFMAIKGQVDLALSNVVLDDKANSILAISRTNNKLAAFYVACCQLFDQMETYKEVNIHKTVIDLHKEINEPIITMIQYRQLYEIIDKEVITKKSFQLL